MCVCAYAVCGKAVVQETSGPFLTVGTVIDTLLEASGRLNFISHDTPEAFTLGYLKPTLIIHIYLYAEIGCLFVSPRKGFLTLHVVEGNARKMNEVGSRINEVG